MRKTSCAKKNDLFRRKENNGSGGRRICFGRPRRGRFPKKSYLWTDISQDMRRLYANLERESLSSEWDDWQKHVLASAERVEFSDAGTWGPLAALGKNIPAVRWLTRQIRCSHPVPPEHPREESVFYMLAAFCADNSVLGYLIDTWQYYCRTRNSRGVLSCARILSLVNRHGEYPHLNALYNLVMGDMLREYRLYVTPADRRSVSSFLTDRDFHLLEKYLPDFRPFGFRERVLAAQNKMTHLPTGEALARECCMSGSVFRKRFKQEFGLPVSEWLRRQRRERIERMLRDPGIPLGEVAERNGFNMSSTFSDYCRRNFGMPPGRMRKSFGES